jgi:hypothetical protein
MFLRPCPRCHRHVDGTEASCPFCTALLPAAAESRPVLRGRVSRAIVFGAALASGACKDKPKIEPAPVTSTGSAAADAATAVVASDAADRAGTDPVIDAGVADAAVADAATTPADAATRERKKLDKQEYLEERLRRLRERNALPKPYGAPPARRRVV